MHQYVFLSVVVASSIFASAYGQAIGFGKCLDSKGQLYDYLGYVNVNPTDCASPTYCGRQQIRGFESIVNPPFPDICYCLFDTGYFNLTTVPVDMQLLPEYSESFSLFDPSATGVGEITASSGSPNTMTCNSNPSFVLASIQGDPTIVGLNGQKFKFNGRDGAWYANLVTEKMYWNMQFGKFEMCPEEENMFVTAASFVFKESASSILIRATKEVDPECYDPHAVCLGGGNLQISLDGGKTFTTTAGDYHFAPGSRVIAHNTYGSCSRKWFDFEVSSKDNDANIRGGHGRRMETIGQKSPMEYVGSEKGSMLEPWECKKWIEDRIALDDLFQQNGLWSTIHIVTPLVSFHVEFRRKNPEKVDDRCDFQSLDTWMTTVSPAMAEKAWQGILGETRYQKHDEEGQVVTTDRTKLLEGKNDEDYEVNGPFGTNFLAYKKGNLNSIDLSSSMARVLTKNADF